jgi:hypothetical protein
MSYGMALNRRDSIRHIGDMDNVVCTHRKVFAFVEKLRTDLSLALLEEEFNPRSVKLQTIGEFK